MQLITNSISPVKLCLQKLQDYLVLCKHKVVALLVLTAMVGQALAPAMERMFYQQAITLVGIGFLAAAAAIINHLVDKDIDGKMVRTKSRPCVKGRVSNSEALMLAALLAGSGFYLLVVFANWLTAWLTLFALVGYAFIYTLLLKRATPQNIVIGGLAGAMPPLLGWVSETGSLSAEPWLLVMIIFTWTPPHFWALAIDRYQDYERANVPMLPVTHGISFCKTTIVLYTVLLALVCVMPYLIGMSGWFYLLSSSVLSGAFLLLAIKLKFAPGKQYAFDLFKFSIWHLMLLFIALLIDKWVFM